MHTTINLLEAWKASEEEVVKNLAILTSELNNDAVHDIRVAIKKLRAYVQLINQLDKNENKDDLLQTKSLFDILGKHREWDTTLEKLNKAAEDNNTEYPLFTKHIIQARNEVAQTVKAFIQTYNIDELNKVENRIKVLQDKKNPEELTDECRNIIKRFIRKLNTLLKHFKKKVHKARKLLKTIFYWMSLFPQETLYSKKQIKLVDDFLDKLGKWQDLQVMLIKINNYCNDYISKSMDEYKALEKLSDDLKDKRNKLFRELKPDDIVKELQ